MAPVLLGRLTAEVNIFGGQFELRVSGELLSVGYEKTFGVFPLEDGGWHFDSSGGTSSGWYGWGYIFRIKVPG